MRRVLQVVGTMLFLAASLWAQMSPSIDLGNIRAVADRDGWRITASSQLRRNGNRLEAGDIVVSVDGKRIGDLNALSAAFFLFRAGLDAETATVIRDRRTNRLDFTPPERLLAHVRLFSTLLNIRMYKRDEPLPVFTLKDAFRKEHTVEFRGRWTLLRVADLHCYQADLAAFDEIARTDELQVFAISGYEEAENVRRFVDENSLGFTTLLGEGNVHRYVDDSDFTVRVIPSAGLPTYIVVDPSAHVVLVSTGTDGLRIAWQFYKSVSGNQAEN